MDAQASSLPPSSDTRSPPLTFSDRFFLLFLVLALVGVTWVGRLSYLEGQKNETIKRHGEAWLATLVTTHASRVKPDGEPKACLQATPEGQAPQTWGDCVDALAKLPAHASMRNPFSAEPLALAEACNPTDRSTVGKLVFRRVDPNPPGSATPTTVNPMSADTALNQPRVVQVKVCDRGGYAINIGETEF